MKTIRILILEDDLETLSLLISKLSLLERRIESSRDPKVIAITVLSEYTQVEDYINRSTTVQFDVILLDRDCKAGGSFHILDIPKFGIDKVIGISSTPPYNDQLNKMGVKRLVHKDYGNLEMFANKTLDFVEELIK